MLLRQCKELVRPAPAYNGVARCACEACVASWRERDEDAKRKRTFWLCDGRAKFGDATLAHVFDVAVDELEAAQMGRTVWNGHDAVWFEYDVSPDNVVTNGRMRADLPPCGGE